jgi:DNA polymerase III alpha subunit (gram-positive type)
MSYKKEIYISIDIETDGPCPGVNSMISLGAAAYDWDGTLVDTWTMNFERIPDGVQNPSTMDFWSENPEAWEASTKDPVSPDVAIKSFYDWVRGLAKRTKKTAVCVAYPAGFDFSFVYYYLMKYVKNSPFSFACLDIKTFAMAALKGGYRSTSKRRMPKHWFPDLPHTHVALDDAKEQGLIFCNILKDVIEDEV